MNHKLLIVGGYGTFGGRLVELLENEKSLTLIVAGRSLDKAEKYCDSRGTTEASLIPAVFDRNGDLKQQLSDLKPDILIDASGPFQNYGDDCYKLIEACIEQKVHYLDLADGADFVNGVSQFDQTAKEAGVYVLSGVSSFPVLTALVVKELSKDMSKLISIKGGIAPSPYAGVGENVIRAIAGYAGQRISLQKDGALTDGYPLTSSMRYTVSPPGYIPLKNTLFSLVDVPDLTVLPTLFPNVKTVWMGAGPVPEILLRSLIYFAWLVRWKVIPSLSPLVKPMQFVIDHVRWGEHRGGMFVEVKGKDKDAHNVTKSWHLLAEGRDGPLIPCMAVEAIMQKVLKGETIPTGARTAIDDIALDDYNRLFEKRTIYTGFRDHQNQESLHLYGRLLGKSWDNLSDKIKEMHHSKETSEAKGVAEVTGGKNPLAKMIAMIIGFPKPGTNVPVNVKFSKENGKETWIRTFGGKSFLSVQYEGQKNSQRLLMERFGPMTFGIALVPDGKDKLELILREWKFLGLKMPLLFGPRSISYEQVIDGKFNFHVEISHPLVGKIVTYKGWLEQVS